jgi:hypothetical protein
MQGPEDFDATGLVSDVDVHPDRKPCELTFKLTVGESIIVACYHQGKLIPEPINGRRLRVVGRWTLAPGCGNVSVDYVSEP